MESLGSGNMEWNTIDGENLAMVSNKKGKPQQKSNTPSRVIRTTEGMDSSNLSENTAIRLQRESNRLQKMNDASDGKDYRWFEGYPPGEHTLKKVGNKFVETVVNGNVEPQERSIRIFDLSEDGVLKSKHYLHFKEKDGKLVKTLDTRIDILDDGKTKKTDGRTGVSVTEDEYSYFLKDQKPTPPCCGGGGNLPGGGGVVAPPINKPVEVKPPVVSPPANKPEESQPPISTKPAVEKITVGGTTIIVEKGPTGSDSSKIEINVNNIDNVGRDKVSGSKTTGTEMNYPTQAVTPQQPITQPVVTQPVVTQPVVTQPSVPAPSPAPTKPVDAPAVTEPKKEAAPINNSGEVEGWQTQTAMYGIGGLCSFSVPPGWQSVVRNGFALVYNKSNPKECVLISAPYGYGHKTAKGYVSDVLKKVGVNNPRIVQQDNDGTYEGKNTEYGREGSSIGVIEFADPKTGKKYLASYDSKVNNYFMQDIYGNNLTPYYYMQFKMIQATPETTQDTIGIMKQVVSSIHFEDIPKPEKK